METMSEIDHATAEMKRTSHNLESLDDTLDFLNGEIAYVTALRIEGVGVEIVKKRNFGKVTREGLRAGRKIYDMGGLSEKREFLEREVASTILSIAEAKIDRIAAMEEMARVCVYE